MSLQAIVPHSVRRKWDHVAMLQLAELAAFLAEENEQLQRRLAAAEQAAEDNWQYAIDMQLQMCELVGGRPGITQGGELMVVQS